MAADENKELEEKLSAPKRGFNIKVFLIGIPLFVVQLVVVYFITANILLSRIEREIAAENAIATEIGGEDGEHAGEGTAHKKPKKSGEAGTGERGTFFYSIDDIIINPAGTAGQRIMLVSVAFDFQSEAEMQVMASKEILVKDMILSVISSKTLGQLARPEAKEDLKHEIAEKINEEIPDLTINNVYFHKFVTQ